MKKKMKTLLRSFANISNMKLTLTKDFIFFHLTVSQQISKNTHLEITSNDQYSGIKLHVGNNLTEQKLERIQCTAGSAEPLKVAWLRGRGTSSQCGFLCGKAAHLGSSPCSSGHTASDDPKMTTSYRGLESSVHQASPSAGPSSE